ncbi:MAG TPA: RNA methyltransferase [Solirubrobacterales bacterium]|nr:RNA methyltransferase [Solirubrobacterales bacterium]
MITSKDNEKLKLVRRLAERKHRDREGLFAVEGEDLLAAALAAGHEPVLVLSAAGSGIDGTEVAPELLDSVSALGSGTRVISVWRRSWSRPAGPVCVYLHGVADPGNVGAVIRTAHALVDGTVALGPGCADPHSPKATRASMGSAFGQPIARAGVEETPRPRIALVAHGGEVPGEVRPPVTICLGAERAGLPGEVVEACERRWTIPLRDHGAESLNVAAAAAIALGRISSAAAEQDGAS